MSRRVLVVGGSGAVGGATVDALVARDATVATTSRREPDIEPLRARHPDLRTFALDLLDIDSIEPGVAAAAATLGGLDALVCCAGVAPPPDAGLADITADDWDALFAVNARGPFLLARAAAPLLCDGGAIVLLGSIDAVRPLPFAAHHAASRAALGGLVGALAKELGPRGITVNVVAPGPLDAGLANSLRADLVERYERHAALGRSGRIPEVAAALAWLATTNTAMTGQVLAVDGGL